MKIESTRMPKFPGARISVTTVAAIPTSVTFKRFRRPSFQARTPIDARSPRNPPREKVMKFADNIIIAVAK